MTKEEKIIMAEIIFNLREYLQDHNDSEVFRAHDYKVVTNIIKKEV